MDKKEERRKNPALFCFMEAIPKPIYNIFLLTAMGVWYTQRTKCYKLDMCEKAAQK